MVELLKEITFDITKSLEVDLSTKKKQKRRKRVDDYDYTDNFIEPFEGEEDLVEIECSISNFFVYQGILPGSIKKVINQYKNKKPVTPPKMMSESRILEDALIMRRKRKASSNVLSDPFIKENEGLEEIYNKLSSKKIKSKKQNIDKKLEDVKTENAIENYDNLPVFNDEVIYKEVVNNYLYKKFKKLKDNYENLNVNDKIVYFVINYMFFEYNPELYEENEKICKKITVDIEEGEILDPNSDFVKYKNINEKTMI
ncbi:thymidylate kinase [Vairimorpha apis BRL 01]|uniref:Thymidylate kinase n=1 Tax=Vairimorpha apis BRL 01 TaxID=1037528 RepID=T0M9I0_9MICR|nr:thymidylate kinase [Vairimorpha apis BRL 01]